MHHRDLGFGAILIAFCVVALVLSAISGAIFKGKSASSNQVSEEMVYVPIEECSKSIDPTLCDYNLTLEDTLVPPPIVVAEESEARDSE